jgi:hypothetical protein
MVTRVFIIFFIIQEFLISIMNAVTTSLWDGAASSLGKFLILNLKEVYINIKNNIEQIFLVALGLHLICGP